MMLKTLVAGTSIQNEIIALKALEQRQALQGFKNTKKSSTYREKSFTYDRRSSISFGT